MFWKIDYYDKQLKFGSDALANPDETIRVLTIMLVEEYGACQCRRNPFDFSGPVETRKWHRPHYSSLKLHKKWTPWMSQKPVLD
ncbi:MAG: DUF3768 domain-containing protein [Planctomycetes bacterium]|nr:DUF3768 domain-containing protein [Planctomycetota bacterium]